MERVSSRHAADLDGRLRSLEASRPVVVLVEVADDVAHLASVQHATWMTVNMLCRLDGVVAEVVLVCPPDALVAGRVIPLAPASLRYRDAVAVGVEAIDTVPLTVGSERTADIRLIMGPGSAVNDGWRVHGEGWWGGAARGHRIDTMQASDLPFGPYMAAAFGVAEVFKAARINPNECCPLERAFYSAWTHRTTVEPDPAGPSHLAEVELDEVFAGVGAVGCIAVHTLWACPGLVGSIDLVDGDKAGIEITNLNRYLLFGRDHLALQKATAAAAIVASSEIAWTAHDTMFDTFRTTKHRILCAVDKNTARAAIQARYPTSLLMASTHDLRAEILRVDPRRGGACARCHNTPEVETPDDERRTAYLSEPESTRTELAAAAGITLHEADEWARTGRCGTAGETLREALRDADGHGNQFAVPFTSLAAGTLLAAEAVKEALDAACPLSPTMPRAVLQYWKPILGRNATAYQRQDDCPMCGDDTQATGIWLERCAALSWRGDGAAHTAAA